MLNNHIRYLQFEEALDEFYDEAIIGVENEDQTSIGMEACRESEKGFIGNVTNYSAELLNVIISDDITVTEWLTSLITRNGALGQDTSICAAMERR